MTNHTPRCQTFNGNTQGYVFCYFEGICKHTLESIGDTLGHAYMQWWCTHSCYTLYSYTLHTAAGLSKSLLYLQVRFKPQDDFNYLLEHKPL